MREVKIIVKLKQEDFDTEKFRIIDSLSEVIRQKKENQFIFAGVNDYDDDISNRCNIEEFKIFKFIDEVDDIINYIYPKYISESNKMRMNPPQSIKVSNDVYKILKAHQLNFSLQNDKEYTMSETIQELIKEKAFLLDILQDKITEINNKMTNPTEEKKKEMKDFVKNNKKK